MAQLESNYLLKLWDRNVCPFCKKSFDPAKRVGTGRKKDGGFCSLSCYTRYYEMDLRAKARKMQREFDS